MERPTTTAAAYAAALAALAGAFALTHLAIGGRWPASTATWAATYALAGVALGGVVDKGGVGARAAIVALAAPLALDAAWMATAGPAALTLGAIAWLAHGVAAARCWSVRDWCGVALLPGWAWMTATFAVCASR